MDAHASYYRQIAVRAVLRNAISLFEKHHLALLGKSWRLFCVSILHYKPSNSSNDHVQKYNAQLSARQQKMRAGYGKRQVLSKLSQLRVQHAAFAFGTYFRIRKRTQLCSAFARWRVQTEANKALRALSSFRIEMITSHNQNLVEMGQLQRAHKRMALSILRVRTLEQQYGFAMEQVKQLSLRACHAVSAASDLLSINKRHLTGSVAEFVALKLDADSLARSINHLRHPALLSSAAWVGDSIKQHDPHSRLVQRSSHHPLQLDSNYNEAPAPAGDLQTAPLSQGKLEAHARSTRQDIISPPPKVVQVHLSELEP